jgi:hypothetical protein
MLNKIKENEKLSIVYNNGLQTIKSGSAGLLFYCIVATKSLNFFFFCPTGALPATLMLLPLKECQADPGQ